MKSRTGLTLIECMIAVLVLSFASTVFAALFPIAMRLRSKSENVTRATMLCQQVIEEARAIPYTSLNYSGMHSGNLIDASPTTSPFSITTIDGLAGQLPQGAGTLTVSNPATDLTQVTVTITWGGEVQNGNSVTASTLIANKAINVQ